TEDDLHLVATAGERVALAVERERLREEAHVGRERLLELAGRMLDVQDQERRAIARELHDEIGQLLTGLLCFLESEDRSVGAGSTDARSARGYRARMRRMKGLVTDVLARVRGLCVDLKSVGEGPRGFEKTLRWHLTRYTAQTGIQVRFRAAVNGSRIPSDLQAACFRIVQESLTNVVRHARTGEAEVRVCAGAGHVHLTIEDRGRGFDVGTAARRTSCGISGMRERARLLGGGLVVRSERGVGTTVAVVLPIPRARPRRGTRRAGAITSGGAAS
ncbi:MAG: sensor histidine kinase, partial [Candidatus Polarisedimenticolia bacterium]